MIFKGRLRAHISNHIASVIMEVVTSNPMESVIREDAMFKPSCTPMEVGYREDTMCGPSCTPRGVGYTEDAMCGGPPSCARMGVGYSSNLGNVPIISVGLPLHKDLGFLRNSFHSDSLD